MTMALKALEEKRCREYEEAMKNREDLLIQHADAPARARTRMLRRDPMLEAFVDKYFTPETRHTSARVMGRSTLKVRVSRPDELPALPKYDKPPILEFRFDGQPFDATKYTDDELLRYHLYWANFTNPTIIGGHNSTYHPKYWRIPKSQQKSTHVLPAMYLSTSRMELENMSQKHKRANNNHRKKR